jgi:hypothetical protein
MFEEIYTAINDPSKLHCRSDEEISELLVRYPALPEDYCKFLREVGFGNLGTLVIYDAPMRSTEVYPVEVPLEGIVLFGDDMQGYCYGFDLMEGGRVVEIDPRGEIDRTVQANFLDFIKAFLI